MTNKDENQPKGAHVHTEIADWIVYTSKCVPLPASTSSSFNKQIGVCICFQEKKEGEECRQTWSVVQPTCPKPFANKEQCDL